MEKLEYSNLEEYAYLEKLENGLTVCIIPSARSKRFYAILGTKYGSMDTEFIPFNKKSFIKTNDGIAHFLEHKAFEMADGSDPFTYFSKTGTNANASTSYDMTKYYIWGINKPYQNIDYLLTYVFSPYFTDENIKKEQGIIGEEIMMYEDNPGWILDNLSRNALFNVLPVKNKISGTKDSIAKITKEELYDCYNTFYVPNNMFLVVGGNIKPEKVLDIVKNNKALAKTKSNFNIVRKKYNESNLVYSEFEEAKANVFIPKLKYSFKIDCNQFSLKDKVKIYMYLNMLSSLLFGTSSEFYEIVHKEQYVINYYVDHYYYSNFYILDFEAESDKADLFKDEVDKIMNNIKIDENEIERMKRVWIASEIKISDNSDLMTENALDDLFIYNRVCNDRIDIIRSLNIKELNKVINELDTSNKSFVLVNPKDL